MFILDFWALLQCYVLHAGCFSCRLSNSITVLKDEVCIKWSRLVIIIKRNSDVVDSGSFLRWIWYWLGLAGFFWDWDHKTNPVVCCVYV